MITPEDQHIFRLFDRNFLFDVPTNSILIVDDEAAAVLQGKAPASPEILVEIDELKAAGLLMPDRLRLDPPARPEAGWIKALCLHVAHDCNLRCTYCFGAEGVFGGTRGIMPPEVGRRAIDLLLARSGSVNPLEVDFFGGEPLLAMDTVRAIMAYSRQQADAMGKRINFTLTTNAVALDEATADYFEAEGISLVLSLDGRPEVHNRFRVSSTGRGSYAAVAAGIQRVLARRRDNYYVRGTFTRFNLDFVKDVEHMLDLGCRIVSIEPVVAPADTDYAIRREDLPRIDAEYERLARLYIDRARQGRPFAFFHFEIDLNKELCTARKLSGCGAGTRYLAVTPTGELYPCHQLVGRDGFQVGDVERGPARPDLAAAFARADIFHKEGCLQCWARYFCSGGCHANAHLLNGDIYHPDTIGCAMMRKRLECALAIKAVLAGEKPREVRDCSPRRNTPDVGPG